MPTLTPWKSNRPRTDPPVVRMPPLAPTLSSESVATVTTAEGRARPAFLSSLSRRRFSSAKRSDFQAQQTQPTELPRAAGLLEPALPRPPVLSAAYISHYAPVFLPGFDAKEEPCVAIRSLWWGHMPTLLVVHLQTLATQLLPAGEFRTRLLNEGPPTSKYVTLSQVDASPYGRTRSRYIRAPQLLVNAGLTRGSKSTDGLFLTVDMCPTHRPFERQFFDALAQRGAEEKTPFPVALCISGLWAHAQTNSFDWFLQQQEKKTLDITWVNHSFSHSYHPDRELSSANMLLSPGINLLHEIYETERILIARGAVPSIFFRFPGLVADERCLQEMHRLGLVPLGSDAWLAQGQVAKPGSIVLVHGNANEPEGIERVMPLIEDSTAHFLPLAQAAIDVAMQEQALEAQTRSRSRAKNEA